MPRREIERATNFIVEDESWAVIEYDHSSVPGTIYLSLTENKINRIYDDVPNKIADTDKRALYWLDLPEETQHFAIDINNPFVPVFTIMKNGMPYTPSEITYISSNQKVVKIINGEIFAVDAGEADIEILFSEWNDIEPQSHLIIHVIVDENQTAFSLYIDGPDKIKLDREEKYYLRSIDNELLMAETFSIQAYIKDINDQYEFIDKNLASFIYDNEQQCYIIKANKKNLLGNILIEATVNNVTVQKEVSIIPLW